MKKVILNFAILFWFAVKLAHSAEPLNEIELLDSHSSWIKFGSIKGPKYDVLLFMSTRCPCSASHENKIKDLASQFGPIGFSFKVIHSNADENQLESKIHFSKSLSNSIAVFEDPRQELADFLGAAKTPHAVILDSTNKIVYSGGVDDSHVSAQSRRQYLKLALLGLSQSNLDFESHTRSLGCIIKRNSKDSLKPTKGEADLCPSTLKEQK